MTIRCMVIDDEPLVRELLEANIAQVPFLQLAHSCRSALEALPILHQNAVDLIFLDIQMPKLTGLQLLQSLPQPPLVIIVTAYEKYAVDSFNLQVADYIVKPFSIERFVKACNRAADLFQLTHPATQDFFVHVEYMLEKIVVADIEYIEGLKDYIKIYLHARQKPVITRMSMKAIEAKLPAGAFLRTHKSFLVAKAKITTVKRDLVCIGPVEIPVSETFRNHIMRLLTS